MAVLVPPDAPERGAPLEQPDVEALIAEARRRARRRRARYAFALASVVLVVVGLYLIVEHRGVTSGSDESALGGGVQFRSCPRQIKVFGRAAKAGGVTGKVVRLDPVAGQLCVYSFDRGAPTPLRWTALLPGARARALALLLDRRGSVAQASCDGGYPALVRLRYRGGGVTSFLAAGCGPELISTPAGLKALSPAAGLAVAGLIDPPLSRGGRVTRVVDYVGEPLDSVVEAPRRLPTGSGGFSFYELDDPGVPFEQVVWQLPLPGSKQPAPGVGARLFVAVHSEPPCRADQLRGRVENGQAVTGGEDLGFIELIDISARACSLRGSIGLQGLSSEGRSHTETYSQPVGPAFELSPRATFQTLERDPAVALTAAFSFIGSSHGDGCQSPNVIPNAWSVRLSNGETLRISNHAHGNGGAFYTCQGSLTRGFNPTVTLLVGPSRAS